MADFDFAIRQRTRRWLTATPVSFPKFRFETRREPAVVPRGSSLRQLASMSRRFVYLLKNSEKPHRYYTGATSNVARRLADHNAGCSIHTAKYGPWSIDAVIEFPRSDERSPLSAI